jgi:hypothetical protein
MIYLCCDKRRRQLLREENERRAASGEAPLNGIDFLEVLDRDAPAGVAPQRTLLVRLFEPESALSRDHVRIEGGERITPVRAEWAFPADAIPPTVAPPAERAFFAALPAADHVLVVRTDSSGDYSSYRLSLVRPSSDGSPPEGFDPLFSVVSFSFKVECPSDFDCAPTRDCPPGPQPPRPVDYLAKDYASFRRLMLDRMALLLPQWRDRGAADLGVTLVEALAFTADRLSYQQDATATEAYLDTARRRVSVRRHARLVDYFMHDGCNARAWVRVLCTVGTSGVVLPAYTPLLTEVLPRRPVLAPGSQVLEDARRRRPVVFETTAPLTLYAAHEEMDFYTWGDKRCCLPEGATRATLDGHFPDLRLGDVLVFAEVIGPRTGDSRDADPIRRHAVRLTDVRATAGGGTPLVDPLNGEHVTEIAWDRADALPFPFCVSSVTDRDHGAEPVFGMSVAWGNIVLADHGDTIHDEDLGVVPPTSARRPAAADRCHPAEPIPIPPRFSPTLRGLPLTQNCPFASDRPAAHAASATPATALPAISLRGELGGFSTPWAPRRDLLNSHAAATEFVVEVEHDGTTRLRFGDDTHGMRPEPGTRFFATYRVGNGTAGNVGAGALFHVVTNVLEVVGITNPMPAGGGVELETAEEVRHRAPQAFRTQERAVTEADYAAMAERDDRVQRAAATLRWTGSWHTVFLTVDPLGGRIADTAEQDRFRREVLAQLERYRMAGRDLEIDQPIYVPLEIEMHVCVDPAYFRSGVRAALQAVFSNRVLTDGRRGVFHPDNFTFQQPVYLSPLYAAAQAVTGVASAEITTFQRQGQPSLEALQSGRLELGRLEIARCDNDPNFPERGVFRLTLGGGK